MKGLFLQPNRLIAAIGACVRLSRWPGNAVRPACRRANPRPATRSRARFSSFAHH